MHNFLSFFLLIAIPIHILLGFTRWHFPSPWELIRPHNFHGEWGGAWLNKTKVFGFCDNNYYSQSRVICFSLYAFIFTRETLSFIIATIYQYDDFRHILDYVYKHVTGWIQFLWDSLFYWRHSLQIIKKKVIPRKHVLCVMKYFIFKQIGSHKLLVCVCSYIPFSLVTLKYMRLAT